MNPVNKKYEAIIEVLGKKFHSTIPQPNIKMAEQVRIIF